MLTFLHNRPIISHVLTIQRFPLTKGKEDMYAACYE